ncbi:MAG: sulfatase [Gemmatimonadota bacterium]|nr:sulfatase [Gemmatimonadota bacterium]
MSGAPITRREAARRVAGAGAGLYAAGALPFLSGCSRSADRPNILLIFSDDHAPHAISAYGSRINRTPHIDRLADEGAIFLNSFCTNSICGPSRAVVLTGKHSHINGRLVNGGEPFDMSQWTFTKALQGTGYETAIIGKWHLGVQPEGFDHWEHLPGQGRYYNPDFRTPAGNVRYEGYVTDIIADLSIDWLREGRDPNRPFLLMSQHKAPHRNWMPGPAHLRTYEGEDIPEPETLFDTYENRASPAGQTEMTIAEHMFPAYDLKITPAAADNETDQRFWAAEWDRMNDEQRAAWEAAYGPRNEAFFAAGLEGRDLVRYYYQRYIKDYLRSVASVDDSVGHILDYLDESGLADNTLVIYCSDQGFYLGEHGWYDKRWMYEESLRMPFLVRWPAGIEPGTRVEHMIQNLDYAPTFLELAGVGAPPDVQGESLVGLMGGGHPADWRTSIYYHYYEFPQPHRVARHYGVRTERHKLVYYYATGEWELFDLEADPSEMRNLYGDPANSDTIAELKSELRRLRTLYADTTGEDFAD